MAGGVFSLRATGVALLALLASASCSSAPVDEESSDDELAANGGVDRWSLPPAVAAAGAKLRLRYEDAPSWDSGRHCTGALREGSRDLGKQLMQRYSAIASVGGYACRQNTADSSRTSVHGTGRAVDVMIPARVAKGRADTKAGDPIANWLVVNAASIGVQLIIWNHSMWRANGTNEAAYNGPNPHVDHIHVELTERAASRGTPFFLQGVSRELADGGIVGTDPYATPPRVDAGNTSERVDASDTYDPNAPLGDGGGDPYVNHDAGPGAETPIEDPNDSYTPDDDPYGTNPSPPSTTSTSTSTGPSGDPSVPPAASPSGATDAGRAPAAPYPNPAYPDDSVGASDSLGTGTRSTPRTLADSSGPATIETCGVARIGGTRTNASATLTVLALALAAVGRRRSRSRRRIDR